jgi:hypothetical protein
MGPCNRVHAKVLQKYLRGLLVHKYGKQVESVVDLVHLVRGRQRLSLLAKLLLGLLDKLIANLL